MRTKHLTNKLNNQKGITGADVAISLFMILVAVGVVMMIYSNLRINSKSVDRKTGATRIATNILENMSQLYYDELENALKINDNTDIYGNVQVDKIYGTTIPSGYTVNIAFDSLYGGSSSGVDNVKKATITVSYNIDDQPQEVSLNKVFTRESIRESNSPNFSNEYIQLLQSDYGLTSYDLLPFSGTDADFSAGATTLIMCPLKYNKSNKKYEIIKSSDLDTIWYSYSNKQWARMVLIQSDELEDLTELEDDITYLTTDAVDDYLTSDNSYVWIPRFGVENSGNIFGDSYFKYKTTNYAIVLDSQYISAQDTTFYYNTLKTIDWSESWDAVTFERGGKSYTGKWCKYSEINPVDVTNATMAYYLNQSQYGPMIEY